MCSIQRKSKKEVTSHGMWSSPMLGRAVTFCLKTIEVRFVLQLKQLLLPISGRVFTSAVPFTTSLVAMKVTLFSIVDSLRT